MREYIILYPRNEGIERRIIKVVMINRNALYLIALIFELLVQENGKF